MSDPPTSNRPRDGAPDVWGALADGGGVAVVADGAARAIVVEVTADELDAALRMAHGMRAQLALSRLQADSVRHGTDAMTLEEINAEIAAARAERRTRGG